MAQFVTVCHPNGSALHMNRVVTHPSEEWQYFFRQKPVLLGRSPHTSNFFNVIFNATTEIAWVIIKSQCQEVSKLVMLFHFITMSFLIHKSFASSFAWLAQVVRKKPLLSSFITPVDIGLPHCSPYRSVQCRLHPRHSRDLHQTSCLRLAWSIIYL